MELKVEKMDQKEHNVEFFISNLGGKESAEVIDLNKIFQMNFSYNFDLLKNLMEALMKNQKNFQAELKEKTNKINDLENQIMNIRLSPVKEVEIIHDIKDTNSKVEPLTFKKLEISNESNEIIHPKLLSVIKGDKTIMKEPPNDIHLDESPNNDSKINDIIVSIIYNIFAIFF